MKDTIRLRDLIEQAQHGNLSAFEKLIKQYDKKVLSLAYQMVGNIEDAEDLYQDVFIKVFDKLPQFQFKSEFYTWLYRIVVNQAINFHKKRKGYMHPLKINKNGQINYQEKLVDSRPGPDTEIMYSELRDEIQRCLNRLPLMQRTVFYLRFYQDFKIKDIAEIIGCSEGTIKNTIFRSTQKMRKALSVYVNIQ